MQAVNATDTGGRGELAARGTSASSSSSLKADFAAMLSDIGDSTLGLGNGTISGIFGAMKELKDQHASLAADISCRRRDLKSHGDNQKQSSDKTQDVAKADAGKTDKRVEDTESASVKESADDDSQVQAQASEVKPDAGFKIVADTELPAESASSNRSMEGEVEDWLGALMQPESTEENVPVQNAVAPEDLTASLQETADDLTLKTQDPSKVMAQLQSANSQALSQSVKTQSTGVTTQDAGLNAQSLTQDLESTLMAGDYPLTSDPVTQMISEEISDSGLSVMMAKAGVTKVTLTQNQDSDVASLSEGISADLEMIDDALQAAASLDETGDQSADPDQDSSWFSKGESAYRDESGAAVKSSQSNTQTQSVTQALAALRASGNMSADESSESLESVESVVTSASSGLKAAAAGESASGTSAEGGAAVIPGSGTLSKSREMRMETQAQTLRDQMLTLSRDARRNAEEITRAVMTMAARNLKTLSFELNPEGMGRMEISIDTDAAEDSLKVNLAAENGATRQLLAQGLSELRESLNRAGLLADAEMSEFTGGEGQPQGNSQDQGSGDTDSSGTLFASGNGALPENDENTTDDAQESGDDALSLYA